MSRNLPIFPTFYDTVTEDRLERVIERMTHNADAALLVGDVTQEEYDLWCQKLNEWAEQYK